MWTENFQMYKLDLEKAGVRDQIANICQIIEKAREFQKNVYFCLIDFTKAEVDVFLELFRFFYDPTDVGNLIFDSSEVKWNEVAQLCLTLCDPMDSSLPGSTVHGIFQARILEWVAISFSRGSSLLYLF